MKFTDLFIRRPVLAIVVSCLLLMLGLQGAGQLSVRQFPDVEKSLVRVSTVYAGASARTVQGFVTEPLQRRIAAAEGVEYMTSRSDPGVSEIDVHVRLGEDTEKVMTAIIAKVGEARFELPREVEDPVITSSLGDDAMIYMAFLSEQMSIQQVYDYVARNIQPELSTLEGVGDAKIYSSRSFAMRVWLDPAKMAAFAVTATDVNRAIREQNYISAAGSTRGMLVRASIDAETDIQSPDQFAGIVVRQDGDQRVRLGDVADLELASADYDSADYSSGRDTVFLAVTPAPGANPLEVAGRVKEVVPRLTAQMPADLKVFYDSDSSVFIKEALVQVVRTLVEASLIVMLVILLFLGSLRVVLIPLVTIPLSLVGVLFLVWAAGFSINLLTLLAMVIAIGLVVDDAIVVVENVHRHIENGMQPVDAAIRGAREVALPVIAMTLTLAAVYAPITFLGGLTGVLFSEFALTLAGAVVVSGIIALTLSPMMCAYLLTDTAHQGALAHWLDARFEALHNAYRRLLGHCLDNRGAVLLFAAVILASLPLLFQMAQRELAPEEDNGSLFVVATPPDYSSVDYVNYFLDQMVSTWKQIPEVSHSWQVNNPGTVFGGIELKPWSERERSQKEIQTDLQAGFARISGLEIFTFSLISLPGADSGLPVNFVIASTADYKELDRVSDEVLAKARESGLFAFVNKTLRYSRPEVTVAIERDLAARLGISMEAIGETLQTMLGESEVNRFSMEGRSYKVIPQARGAGALLRAHRRWRPGTAGDRDPARFAGRAEHAQPVPAAQQHHHPGHDDAAQHAWHGARVPRPHAERSGAGGFSGRVRGRITSLCAGDHWFRGTVRGVADVHLPGTGRAVQQLSRSAGGAGSGTAVDIRRDRAACARLGNIEHLYPGGPADADRADQQARHPDRGFRQPPAGRGHGSPGRGDRGCRAAAAPDPDDDLRYRARCIAAAAGLRCRCQQPFRDRPGDHIRHAGGYLVHAVRAADVLSAVHPPLGRGIRRGTTEAETRNAVM